MHGTCANPWHAERQRARKDLDIELRGLLFDGYSETYGLLPMCSRLLGHLPSSDENPSVSPKECALGLSGCQGLPVGASLSCASYQFSHTIPAISSLSYCRAYCQTHEFHTVL
jgi:hypothetical protein